MARLEQIVHCLAYDERMKATDICKALILFFLVSRGLAACGEVVAVNDAGARDTGPQFDAGQPAFRVTGISPATGIITTTATIRGELFGSEGSVTVAGVSATVVSWADTDIEISIPDLLPGQSEVVVTSGSMSDSTTFTVVLPPRLYINNQPSNGNGSLSVMSFSANSQSLTQIGNAIPLANPSNGFVGCGDSIALHVESRRVFATTRTAVAVLEIDGVTGGLTLLGETNLSNTVSGIPPALSGLIVNAAGNLLFANSSSGIHVVRVDPNGSLTELSSSPFELGTDNDIPRLSDDENFLFVNREGGNFDVFAVAANGALSPISGTPFAGFHASSFTTAKRPGVPQIYLSDGNQLSVLTYDESTGQPIAVTGNPFIVSNAEVLHHMAFTSNNRLYVAELGRAAVHIFQLDAAGVPTAKMPPFSAYDAPLETMQCLLATRTGTHMLALDSLSSQIAVFTFNGDGSLAQVANSPFGFTATGAVASGMVATF